MALAMGTNTSFLDRLYKNYRQQCTLTCSGLQLAKQLDLREDNIVTIIVMEVVLVDSVSGVLPSHVLQERWQAN